MPFLELAGRRFEYEDVDGDPRKTGLLLLHHGLGSVGLWRGFHRTVAEATGRRTVAYSRLGHGASDSPARPRTLSFMDEEARDVLPPLLARLDLRAPVMIGHSDGASIALVHAASHPVAGLVLMAPHVFVEEITLRGIREARDAYTGAGLRERMATHHRDPDACFHGWCDVWLDPDFAAWSLAGILPHVRCPVLLVQGEDDQYGSVAQLEMIERGVGGPVERRLLAACRHDPYLERPEQTLAAVRAFVERVAAP